MIGSTPGMIGGNSTLSRIWTFLFDTPTTDDNIRFEVDEIGSIQCCHDGFFSVEIVIL
jgi:hypothetical protein